MLEENSKVQLICVGPVIDLYGKFAALKLEKMMEKYPGRVFSKPEFTLLPPCIFSGAEFALIPSRDEPFGLVAVEFGRKGALGVGSRVGGLGQMPGEFGAYTSFSNSTNLFKAGGIRWNRQLHTTWLHNSSIASRMRLPVKPRLELKCVLYLPSRDSQ